MVQLVNVLTTLGMSIISMTLYSPLGGIRCGEIRLCQFSHKFVVKLLHLVLLISYPDFVSSYSVRNAVFNKTQKFVFVFRRNIIDAANIIHYN